MHDRTRKGPGRGLTFLLFGAFLLSGMTGLAAEVVWGKFLQLSIGATGAAQVVVLSTFMFGLALGNALFGWLGDRLGGELRLYGFLELGVGLTVAVFPMLFSFLSGAYLELASPDPSSTGNLLLRIALSASLLLVPATLMGGTLPVLSRLLVKRVEEVGSTVGALYFINSLGAVFGCALAGFVLLPYLGLELAIVIPALANVLIGLGCLAWARLERTRTVPVAAVAEGPDEEQTYRDDQIRWTLFLMFCAGTVTMVYEVAWTRLLSLVLGSSVYSFSIMLMTFIGGISLGGLVVARLLRTERDALLYLGLAELGVWLAVMLLMPLYEVLPYLFNQFSAVIVRTRGTFPYYLTAKVVLCFMSMALPTILIGATLPLASRVCVRRLSRVGTGVGSVFSLNTLGNVLGAMVVGHWLVRTLGLQWAMLVGMAASGLLGAGFLAVRGGRLRHRLLPVTVVVAVTAVVLPLVPEWQPAALNSGRYRTREALTGSLADYRAQLRETEALYQVDGLDMSVAVLRARATGHLSMMVNGKPDAATGGDMSTQVLLGLLPVMLHPAPESVLVVGLGSGVTAGATLTDTVRHLDVLEIAAEVATASRLFDPYSGAPLDDPRTELTICDARDYLLLNQERARYDVIVSEPSNPWMAGIGNLMTLEFFRAAARTLNREGVMVQWLHTYEMSPEVLGVVLNTFSAVFPNVTVWCPRNADLLLVGALQPLNVSRTELDERLRQPTLTRLRQTWGTRATPQDGLELLSLQMLSNERFKALFPGEGRLNTDLFPYVEYQAPKAFYTGEDVRDFFALDERVSPRNGSGLLLARELGRMPLSDRELRQLIGFFGEGTTQWDGLHMKRLIHLLLLRSTDVSGGGLGLGAVDAAGADRLLDPYLRRGDHADLGQLLLWQKKVASGLMAPDDWHRYRLFEKGLVEKNTTVWGSPDLARYEFALQQCLGAGGELRKTLEAEHAALRLRVGESPPAVLP